MGWRDAPIIEDEVPIKNAWESAPLVEEEPEENPGYRERVSSGFDKALSENIERQKGGANPIVSTLRTLTEAPQIAVSEIPGVKPLGKAIGSLYGNTYGRIGGMIKKGYENAPPLIKKAADATLIPGALKAIPKVISKADEVLPQTAKDALVTGLNLAEYIPAAKGVRMAEQGTKAGLMKTGEGLESLGKMVKPGELKMTKPVANKAYGKTLDEKKQTIVNDIAEFGTTKLTNKRSAIDAMEKAQQRFDKADEIATTLKSNPNTPLTNIDNVLLKDIDVEKLADIDLEDSAIEYIQSLVSKMDKKGFRGEVTLDQLIKAKQSLNRQGKVFGHGPAPTDEDALKQVIKKKMYLNLVDAIGELSPEIKAMNQEGKRLLDVHAALTGAASREANLNAAGLTDWVVGGATIANPGSLAVTAPLLVTKKALGGGRFGNLSINAGRFLQGKNPKSIEETLAKVAR
jgi:hypothetical protein